MDRPDLITGDKEVKNPLDGGREAGWGCSVKGYGIRDPVLPCDVAGRLSVSS